MFTKETLFMYSKKILIVDDTPLFIKLVQDFFRREQVVILTADNGLAAIKVIKEERPDLVFMDLYMPGMDGDKACLQIKNDYKFRSIPIVMLTSSNRPEDVDRCRKAGCDALIHKPLMREDFIDVSKKYISFPKWSGVRGKINVQANFKAESDQPRTATLYDISVGGVFLETEELYPVGTILSLEFRLTPRASMIHCQGRVAWLNRKFNLKKENTSIGMGIEFIDIQKIDLLGIQSWVRRSQDG